MLGALAAAVVVAAVAWLLRRGSAVPRAGSDGLPTPDDVDRLLAEASGAPAPRGARSLGEEAGEEDEDDADPREVVALTSDGWAFVPVGSGVKLVPPGEPGDETEEIAPAPGHTPIHPITRRRVRGWNPGEPLGVGDLIAARLRRGAPDHDPWRLEALGRDRELRAWRFETEEAARAALELVERRIVRPPLDRDGEPVEIGDADFAEARRIEEQTEAELANDFGPEDEEELR
jgi:hypothetical protein